MTKFMNGELGKYIGKLGFSSYFGNEVRQRDDDDMPHIKHLFRKPAEKGVPELEIAVEEYSRACIVVLNSVPYGLKNLKAAPNPVMFSQGIVRETPAFIEGVDGITGDIPIPVIDTDKTASLIAEQARKLLEDLV